MSIWLSLCSDISTFAEYEDGISIQGDYRLKQLIGVNWDEQNLKCTAIDNCFDPDSYR